MKIFFPNAARVNLYDAEFGLLEALCRTRFAPPAPPQPFGPFVFDLTQSTRLGRPVCLARVSHFRDGRGNRIRHRQPLPDDPYLALRERNRNPVLVI